MVMGMISSLGVYEVISSTGVLWQCPWVFGSMRSLVELEGFSPDGLVLCHWGSERVLEGFENNSWYIQGRTFV